MTDGEKQAHVHEALVEAMREVGFLDDDQILTGWHVAWETVRPGASPTAGSMFGPESMTAWRAIGLIQWADRFCIGPDEDDDDEG